ncbi:hypothetical protein [Runella sp.]
MIAFESNQDWLVSNWRKGIEIFNRITLNIPSYLEKEGIPLE